MQATGNIKKVHRVFIVDDHPIVRNGLSQLINHEKDLTVCGEAGDAPNALRAIADCKPDIVIVDLDLEHDSGLRLIENLSYSHRDILILVLSMHDESMYAERCFRTGAKGYISKEDQPEKLITALRTVLNGKIYVSNELGENLLLKHVAGKFKDCGSPVDVLSNREMEIFKLLGKGLKKEEIAEQLMIGINTVNDYIRHIRIKMNLESLREIIVHAFRFNNEIL